MALRNIPLKWSTKHRTRLEKAAGVAKVDLLCTALTWRMLRTQATTPYSTVGFPGLANRTDSRGALPSTVTRSRGR
ncbi:hypothetical protein OHA79_51980 (plasmid) [Streptomyces sp. NBC_00841]|uniref:hypothetical protein n=1 Tax=Streptomyces sp. NBC_00841 TaxID=2975847 RepID=UPI002DDA56D0|nr:hypothetical protein [Streptomyces sp. NBC_00841]WSA06003.1 hypothetical protein OHA79_51980 [Streptomyces sp. NBC_00841]